MFEVFCLCGPKKVLGGKGRPWALLMKGHSNFPLVQWHPYNCLCVVCTGHHGNCFWYHCLLFRGLEGVNVCFLSNPKSTRINLPVNLPMKLVTEKANHNSSNNLYLDYVYMLSIYRSSCILNPLR